MVENAEGGNDAHKPDERQREIEPEAREPEHRDRSGQIKNLAVHVGGNQDHRRERHGQHQLHLMMQYAAVVEGAHYERHGGGNEDAKHLRPLVVLDEDRDREHGGQIDRQPTQ